MAAGFMQWENAFFPWTLNYDEIDMVLEGELHVRHQGKRWSPKRGRHVHPERLQHRIRYPVDGALPVRRTAGKLAIAMNDFITEAWLRANHTLSEGGEIHLPADARLTPSARNCWKVGICGSNFDRRGRLFVEDDEQTPQPVHVLTSSDHPPGPAASFVTSRWAKAGHLNSSDGRYHGGEKRSAAGLPRGAGQHHRPDGVAAN